MTDEAEQAGGRIVVDGRGLVVDGHENGNFVGPIVVTDLDRDHPTYTEEVFGPVMVGMHVNNRSEEHTSELQSRGHIVCRLLHDKTIIYDGIPRRIDRPNR